tara:strand:- start:372 stop:644 length:273 start_codon:yes stop_codon:yes gene_type:complete
MVARIREAAPLNLAKAKALAEDFGTVSHRSVISKAQSLGVEYVKAAPAARQPRGITKAEYLSAIREGLALPAREGDLTKAELSAVLMAIA